MKLRYVAGDDGEDGGAFELLSARDLGLSATQATISYGALDNNAVAPSIRILRGRLRGRARVAARMHGRVRVGHARVRTEEGSVRGGLDVAVRGAHLDCEVFGQQKLLWALRVLLASDE